MSKITTLSELRKILPKSAGTKNIVLFSGVFDLFHYAHLKALKTAKSFGDILVVQVDGNKLVKHRKGDKRPYLDQYERAGIISSLEFVDYVFISNIPSEDLRILKGINPYFFVRAILPNQSDAQRIQREKILNEKIPNGKMIWLKQSPEISTTKIIPTIQKHQVDRLQKNENVTIGIAAYNATDNIKQLLESLLMQKGISRVDEIIVHSDASIDNTVKIAKHLESPYIKVIDARERRGFAASVKAILKSAKSKVVIILNDDIKITDVQFVEKLLQPFENEAGVGLVSGNPQPMCSSTFIEKAVISSFKAYEAMRNNLKNEHNEFTCDGKVMALSRNFYRDIDFPDNHNKIGNVDAYLYFSCLVSGFKYRHVKKAKIYYRCPSNLKDYLSLTARNNSQFFLLKNQFGKIVKKEYQLPKVIYKYYLKEFIKNPLGCMFILLTGIYLKIKVRSFEKWLNSTWDVIESTKKLSETQHV